MAFPADLKTFNSVVSRQVASRDNFKNDSFERVPPQELRNDVDRYVVQLEIAGTPCSLPPSTCGQNDEAIGRTRRSSGYSHVSRVDVSDPLPSSSRCWIAIRDEEGVTVCMTQRRDTAFTGRNCKGDHDQ